MRNQIKRNQFIFNGKCYFRTGSEDMFIGTLGRKQKAIGKPNQVEAQMQLPERKIGKVKVQAFAFNSSKSITIEPNLKIEAIIGGTPSTLKGEMLKTKIEKNELKFLKLSVPLVGLRDTLNDSPRFLKELKSWKSKSRAIYQIIVVVSADLAKEITAQGQVDLDLTPSGFNIKSSLPFSSTKSSKLFFPKGATFAYMPSRIQWKRLGLKKGKISKLIKDEFGIS